MLSYGLGVVSGVVLTLIVNWIRPKLVAKGSAAIADEGKKVTEEIKAKVQ